MFQFILSVIILGLVVFSGLALFSVCLAYFIDSSEEKDEWED